MSKLYLVATPIGNLSDITSRALEVLEMVDYIAVEDTRVSIKLLNYYNIKKRMIAYHEHNKYEKAVDIINLIKEGNNIAYISDAGTPGISDPGLELVKEAIKEEVVVTSIPGAVAFINALIISGEDTRRFVFEGFLPYENKKRIEILEELEKETRTIILYEAPHKLKKTLQDIRNIFGNRYICLVKELTKTYETVYRGYIYDIELEPKGEFVIIIRGKSKEVIKEEEIKKFENKSEIELYNQYISDGLDKKEALKLVAKNKGISKREVYKIIHQSIE